MRSVVGLGDVWDARGVIWVCMGRRAVIWFPPRRRVRSCPGDDGLAVLNALATLPCRGRAMASRRGIKPAGQASTSAGERLAQLCQWALAVQFLRRERVPELVDRHARPRPSPSRQPPHAYSSQKPRARLSLSPGYWSIYWPGADSRPSSVSPQRHHRRAARLAGLHRRRQHRRRRRLDGPALRPDPARETIATRMVLQPITRPALTTSTPAARSYTFPTPVPGRSPTVPAATRTRPHSRSSRGPAAMGGWPLPRTGGGL